MIKYGRTSVRFYTVVLFGAELSQDKSAHFYRYNCSFTSDAYN